MKKAYRKLIASAALVAVAGTGAMAQTWGLAGNTVAAGEFIGSTNSAPWRLKTNGTERMQVDASGNVGIGTSSPGRILHIHTNPSAPQLRISDFSGSAWDTYAGADFHIRTVSGPTDWLNMNNAGSYIKIGPNSDMYVSTSTGNVGFGTISPVSKLTINGSLTAGNTLCFMGTSARRWDDIWSCHGTLNTSDARMKENIQDLGYGLDALMKLHPVSFSWKNDPAHRAKLGLIAQEVRTVVPEVVKGGENDTPLGIFYSDLIPVLIKSVQQQQGTLESERQENMALRETLAAQERQIAELESALGIASPSTTTNGSERK